VRNSAGAHGATKFDTIAQWRCVLMTMNEFDSDLDVRGLNCPLPILRAKKALATMSSGQVLRVVATDPGSVRDFQAFSKQTGNELLSHATDQTLFTFFLRKK
jgi:tRNA 2-thiouridine synthesizing protein A